MMYFLFILLGFVLGSTLFAYWIPRLFFKTDITKVPPDHNPGVANATCRPAFLPELSPCSVNFSKALSRFFLQTGS